MEGGEPAEQSPLGLRVLARVLVGVLVGVGVLEGPLPRPSRTPGCWRQQSCHGWCRAPPPPPSAHDAAAEAVAGVRWAHVWVRQPSVALPGGWGLQVARPQEARLGAWAAAPRPWSHRWGQRHASQLVS